MKINLSYGIFLIFGIFLASYVLSSPVFGQLPSSTGIGVKIDTPADSASLPVGDLTIYGTSSDSNTTNCQVFADWNDLKPMQTVTPTGPKGSLDYSKWSFTYTGSYHGITEGTNELTSKITCYEQGQSASSKSYSINVTGIESKNKNTNNTVQNSTEIVDTANVANEHNNIMPLNSNSNDTDTINNTVQSTEDVASQDVSSQDVSSQDVSSQDVSSQDVSSQDVSSQDVSSQDVAVNDAVDEHNNLLSVNSNSNNSDSINNTVQSAEDVSGEDIAVSDVANDKVTNDKVANENVNSEDTDISSIDDSKNNGTFKILPLYSQSDEESTTSTSTEDSSQTGIRNMKTAGSQDGITSTQTTNTGSGTYNTFSSDKQGMIGETNNMGIASEASDEGLTSRGESNTFFTYEPDLIEDESNQNQVNTFDTNSDTDSSFSNHKIDGNSIFGLKFNGPDDVTQNKIEKRVEKLEDRIADRMSMFDLIG
jgi:hypothetical protein